MSALEGRPDTPDLANETHLWLVASERLPEERLSLWRGWLSPEESRRLAAIKAEAARRQLVAGRGLARETLSRYAPVEPSAWRFSTGPNGRLEVAAPESESALRFNLSHTSGFVALAVAVERAVGVDVQMIDRSHDLKRLAVRRFHRAEAELFRDWPDDDELARRFYTHWTLKEALVKAQGAAMARGLRRFAIEIDGDRAGFVDAEARESPADWRLHLFDLRASHLLAVVDRRSGAGPLRLLDWRAERPGFAPLELRRRIGPAADRR